MTRNAARPRFVRATLVGIILVSQALAAGPAPAATLALSDDFSNGSVSSTKWRTWWGTVGVHDALLSLASRAPSGPSQTYSALVTSRKAWSDFAFAYNARTVKPLRTGSSANTWEVAWSMFRFRDLENYYYFILKPNGWELGKKHGSDAQIFLATGESPAAAVGRTDRIEIRAKGALIRVWVNRAQILAFTDPHPISSGSVGLYEEDAHVHFDTVRVYVA